MNDNSLKNGYIALITVLIVGSISFAVTLGVLSIGVVQTQTGIVFSDGYNARLLADACAEYALQEIRDSTGFSGSATYVIGSGECDYNVISSGSESRTIESTGTVKNTVQRVLVDIDDINPSINIVSWWYVNSF